eukprot:scaffold10691_cov46-Attheya_sp.AAC.3
MATTSVSEASAMLHVNADPQATTTLPRDNTPDDVGPRPRKRQKQIIHAESEQREYNTRTAAAMAAASFQTEEPATAPPPPPLQKEVCCDPLFDRCDNGVGLRLIDVCTLKKGLEHIGCHKCSEKNRRSFFSFFEFHGRQVANARKWKDEIPSPDASYELLITTEKKNCSSTNHLVSCVQLKSETVGFATSLHFECKECEHKVSVESQKV